MLIGPTRLSWTVTGRRLLRPGGKIQLRSRNGNGFTERYSSIAAALRPMPDESVLYGEIAALDEDGRRSFNLLQSYGSAESPLVYFVFDLLTLKGRTLMTEPPSERRSLLERVVLPKLAEPIRHSPEFRASLLDLVSSVESAGLDTAHRMSPLKLTDIQLALDDTR